ncbi:MAG: homoserine O-acetyltransferase [Opitutae bacterium]
MSTPAEQTYFSDANEVGIVEEKTFVSKETFSLTGGGVLEGFQLRYECYGQLNPEKDNAIYICHALTGDHHVAGIYSHDDEKPGWWNHVVGPGKPIDTNRFFVISANCLGGCRGSTGPSSDDPQNPGASYGANFPDLSICDMIRAQRALIDHLGIYSLHAVVGGSMGGMQALQWIVEYPGFAKNAIIIAATAQHSVQTIAFNEAGRCSIRGDLGWKNGKYEKSAGPAQGLSVARMMAHITYLSDLGMEEKFGGDRRLDPSDDFEFSVQGYLDHQGKKFVDRFDANSYLKLTEALDRFNLVGEHGLSHAVRDVDTRTMVIAFSSDWLYTPKQNKDIVDALLKAGKNASYLEINHSHGHDSFLIDSGPFLLALGSFLQGEGMVTEQAFEEDGFRKLKNRYEVKKEVDFRAIDDWVAPRDKVLDLGCGRGLLLEHLRETKDVHGLGVDWELNKSISCISRQVPIYQEEILAALSKFSNNSFDWVIFSRMVESLPEPGKIIEQAIRVGHKVAVSFVNHGYWRNRWNFLLQGRRVCNEVYPHQWESSHLSNHFSIREFEDFSKRLDANGMQVNLGRKLFYRGDWVKQCSILPNLRAGLAIYEIVKSS